MRNRFWLQLTIGLLAFVLFEGSAWCTRVDKGGSGLGTSAPAPGCPASSGPASMTFTGVSVTCSMAFSTGAPVFDFHSSNGPFSTLSVSLNLPDGVDEYGVVTCPSQGTLVCTTVSNSSLISISPDVTSGSPETASLNVINGAGVTGDIVLYFDSPATVTAARASASSVPEPGSLALVGFGMAVLLRWRARRSAIRG
jgi:hypothetical protein